MRQVSTLFFFFPVPLQTSNSYHDLGRVNRCKRLSRARKRLMVYKPPSVLTIQLKRFNYFSSHGGKINRHIEFDETLNLRKVCESNYDIKYKLYAVLVHQGDSTHSGHYYSFVRTGNSWFEMNDSHVRQVTISEVLRQRAYILFYMRDPSSLPQDQSQTSIKKQPKVSPSSSLPCFDTVKQESKSGETKSTKISSQSPSPSLTRNQNGSTSGTTVPILASSSSTSGRSLQMINGPSSSSLITTSATRIKEGNENLTRQKKRPLGEEPPFEAQDKATEFLESILASLPKKIKLSPAPSLFVNDLTGHEVNTLIESSSKSLVNVDSTTNESTSKQEVNTLIKEETTGSSDMNETKEVKIENSEKTREISPPLRSLKEDRVKRGSPLSKKKRSIAQRLYFRFLHKRM
eukprot:TRINITY_DN264_c0_g1_i2.p1 TRINITY_DN264_c0_g1~~TRINITY_DN264_c0_g1_i2.p1  ORF type:complete len:404 (+),score=85.05 TRINITY_DN264_c0_g1_i2:996-2207(+)